MPPAVDVTDLTVHRRGAPVLNDVTCHIPAGEVTGLLGPSGSGKTTFMRTVVGVQRIHAGAVRVLELPAGHPRLRHRIGYVTQSPSIYSDMTVKANVDYFGTMYGVDAARVKAAIADVGLADAAHRFVGALSGGERARVSLACALVARPELLVLDEPTVGQDPVLRRDLWAHFHDLADRGVTLLISSHVMDEAARCDRLLFIRDGRLIADDSPPDLLRRTGTPDLESAFLLVASQLPEGA